MRQGAGDGRVAQRIGIRGCDGDGAEAALRLGPKRGSEAAEGCDIWVSVETDTTQKDAAGNGAAPVSAAGVARASRLVSSAIASDEGLKYGRTFSAFLCRDMAISISSDAPCSLRWVIRSGGIRAGPSRCPARRARCADRAARGPGRRKGKVGRGQYAAEERSIGGACHGVDLFPDGVGVAVGG